MKFFVNLPNNQNISNHFAMNLIGLPKLNLPPISPDRIVMQGDSAEIYDPIRRKWVVLTPEEWVRQHFVDWLVADRRHSPYHIANEYSLRVNELSRRCDTVVFDKFCRPAIVVEYKAPHIAITQRVFDQIARYNISLKARYVVVSNGMEHFCCEIDFDAKNYRFIREVPTRDMIQQL